MKKNTLVIISIMVFFIALFALLSPFSPRVIDWKPSFNTKDKTPLGLFVLDSEIDSLLGNYVERSKVSFDDYFYDGIFEDSFHYDYCFLYINQEFKLSHKQTEKLCKFIEEGNSAFISAVYLPQILKDTLNIDLYSLGYQNPINAKYDSITLITTVGAQIKDSIVSNTAITGSNFLSFDTCNSTIFGSVRKGNSTKANFIKTKFGKGYFFIHLEPAVFSNYYLLQKDFHKYAEGALSYIPDYQNVIWSLDNQTSKVISDSPFRFILSQPALKWAWYLLTAGILTFVIFNIRRGQRVIHHQPFPLNTSVEFAKTIGNLYFQEGDIRNIMNKKILYLLEKIRSDYNLATDMLDEKFSNSLHLRSGRDIKTIERMILLINKHQKFDYNCTSDDLGRLNTAIENFYNLK